MYLNLVLLLLGICGTWSASIGSNGQDQKSGSSDLATAETSAKFLNLFGTGSGYPNYGYNYRPTNGYYPGSSGYYPNSGYYPGTVSGYYGSNSGYYGSNTGSYYPGNSGNYYPSSGSYYPSTNILGTQGAYGGIGGYGGYGGYGGNGGLRQYSGYWQPNYAGQRNRGYGYYENTDRFGLPSSSAARDRDSYYNGYGSSSASSSGYNGGYRRGYD